MAAALLIVGLASGLVLISLGGGLYEVSVVDPAWPSNPALIRPRVGGISRRRFWIPAHVAFELLLLGSLVLCWGSPAVRACLLVALISHGVMRIWSAVDFIPKALAFERGGSLAAARRWVARSRLRLPLDLLTGTAVMAAFATLARAA